MTILQEREQRGIEEGMELGIQQGMELARKEEKRNLAKNLLVMGDPVDKIVMATGLTEEEIEGIRDEIPKN